MMSHPAPMERASTVLADAWWSSSGAHMRIAYPSLRNSSIVLLSMLGRGVITCCGVRCRSSSKLCYRVTVYHACGGVVKVCGESLGVVASMGGSAVCVSARHMDSVQFLVFATCAVPLWCVAVHHNHHAFVQ